MSRIEIGTCIYCGENKPFSREHYLPRCLGNFRNFETLDDRICTDCNNSFKQLEEQFCRTSPEAFFRERLAIEGRKSHAKVSPFYRGSVGADRLSFIGKLPDEDYEILYELNRGTKTIKPMRHIILIMDDGQRHYIPIPDDMKEHTQLRAKFEELGIKRSKEARIFAAESEMEWMQSLLSGFSMDSQPEWQSTPDKGTVHGTVTSMVTSKYFRALAKIAFHYFLKYMPQFRGSGIIFTDIKEFIRNGEAGDVSRFVSTSLDQVAAEVHLGLIPTSYCHLLGAGVSANQLWCKLQFFLGPEYLAPVHLITLAENPEGMYPCELKAHSFTYYESGLQDGYDGEITEAIPMNKAYLEQLKQQILNDR